MMTEKMDADGYIQGAKLLIIPVSMGKEPCRVYLSGMISDD